MRTLRACALVLALSLALVVFGCGEATPSDDALDAASEHVDSYNEGYAAAFTALRELNSPDRSIEHWKRVAKLFVEAEAWMPKRRAALESADAEWRKVLEMDAPDEAKRHAELMRDVVAIKQREEAKTSEILSTCKQLSEYYSSGNVVDSVARDKWSLLGKLDQEAVQISAEVCAKQKEAVAYCDWSSLFRTWDETEADY